MLINRIPMEILPVGATTEQPSGDKGLSAVAVAILYHSGEIPAVNIPKGTKRLRSYILNDCWPSTPLVVTVPEGVTEVHSKAFGNCDLGRVEFPSTVTALPADCFVDASPGKIIFHAPKGSITGFPWGADNEPEIEWKG